MLKQQSFKRGGRGRSQIVETRQGSKIDRREGEGGERRAGLRKGVRGKRRGWYLPNPYLPQGIWSRAPSATSRSSVERYNCDHNPAKVKRLVLILNSIREQYSPSSLVAAPPFLLLLHSPLELDVPSPRLSISLGCTRRSRVVCGGTVKPVRLSSLEMRRVCAARAPTMMPQETNHPPARSALLDSMCRCKVLPRRAPVDGRRMSSLHPCLSPFFPFSAGARAIVSGAALQAHSSSMPRLLYVIFAFCLLMPSILDRHACSRVWPAVAGGARAPPDCALSAPCLKRPASLPLRLLYLSATRRGRLRGRKGNRRSQSRRRQRTPQAGTATPRSVSTRAASTTALMTRRYTYTHICTGTTDTHHSFIVMLKECFVY